MSELAGVSDDCLEDLIARYGGRVPRYTSYPTAPHFSTKVDAAAYGSWLAVLPDVPVSLYLHVPFCDRLCLYCGCHTSVMRREQPKRAYTALLAQELRMVAARIGRPVEVSHVHWGGGTPTALPADCLSDIMALIRDLFTLRGDAEIAIEIDPVSLPPDRLAVLAEMGITRASLGVQDFNPRVQAAIGRMQSFEQTASCAAALRSLGIASLNLDLIYGLPHQTVSSVQQTATQALDLEADRIAVFGYAHVPWMKRHQALISDDALPGAMARFAQDRAIAQILEGAGGYLPVGLDHYARPGDAMAQAAATHSLHRSFQGYTTDAAPALIGIGASSIGCLPQGYTQNVTNVLEYRDAIEAGQLPVARGIALTPDDRLRRDVIERIMCDLRVDLAAAAQAHGADPAGLFAGLARMGAFVEDGLVRLDGTRIEVTAAGRPFVRNVAAVFDRYLTLDGTARHAPGV